MMTTTAQTEMATPEAQQRFEDAAVRSGEVRDGRTTYFLGHTTTHEAVWGNELGVQQVHELMAEAFDRRSL